MQKHPLIFSTLTAAVCMFLIPIGLTVMPADALMPFAFLFLYVMAPVWSLVAGVWASSDVHRMWSLPLISAGLAVLGCWTAFSWGNTDFLILAAIYAAIGYGTMGIAFLIQKRRRTRTEC